MKNPSAANRVNCTNKTRGIVRAMTLMICTLALVNCEAPEDYDIASDQQELNSLGTQPPTYGDPAAGIISWHCKHDNPDKQPDLIGSCDGFLSCVKNITSTAYNAYTGHYRCKITLGLQLDNDYGDCTQQLDLNTAASRSQQQSAISSWVDGCLLEAEEAYATPSRF